jgi:hypothetical protein
MNLSLTKKERDTLDWVLDRFINLHTPEYEIHKEDIENSKSLLNKLRKSK